jgi:hypothetical protein
MLVRVSTPRACVRAACLDACVYACQADTEVCVTLMSPVCLSVCEGRGGGGSMYSGRNAARASAAPSARGGRGGALTYFLLSFPTFRISNFMYHIISYIKAQMNSIQHNKIQKDAAASETIAAGGGGGAEGHLRHLHEAVSLLRGLRGSQ